MTPVPGSVDYSATPPAPLRPSSDPPRTLAIEIPPELAGLRLDQALARLLPEHSRSRLQDWIRRARVQVDGASAQPRQKVWGGERIDVHPDGGTAASVDLPQALPLAVVFEDDAILVLDKPAGMVVHPGSGNRDGTLLNALLHHAPVLAGLPRAGIVHRLDKDTSGLLVVAKTPRGANQPGAPAPGPQRQARLSRRGAGRPARLGQGGGARWAGIRCCARAWPWWRRANPH